MNSSRYSPIIILFEKLLQHHETALHSNCDIPTDVEQNPIS